MTASERVARGISWLDSDNKNIVPKNWRSLLSTQNLQFANPDKGPLGVLFGSYLTGIKKMHIIGGASKFGFRSEYRLKDDPKDLKKAWAKALKTDNKWIKLSYCMFRRIKGVLYLIQQDPENIGQFWVEERKSGQTRRFPNTFTNYDSSKRFVRKISSYI